MSDDGQDRKVVPLRLVAVPEPPEIDTDTGGPADFGGHLVVSDALASRALVTARVRESWGGLIHGPTGRKLLVVVPPGTPADVGVLPGRLAWWQLWGTAAIAVSLVAGSFAGFVLAGPPGAAAGVVGLVAAWITRRVMMRSLMRRCGDLDVAVRPVSVSSRARLDSVSVATTVITSTGPSDAGGAESAIGAPTAAYLLGRGLAVSAARVAGDVMLAEQLHDQLWRAVEPE